MTIANGETGITCPKCKSKKSGVVDSRPTDVGIRRRRACADCKHRFSTIEVVIPERYACTPVQIPD